MKTKKVVMAAMLAALICVTTMFIKVPMPFKGYINLGDCFVLLAGWMLSPVYGFFAAAIGSAMADVFAGFAVYAPATFVIKGLMALIAHMGTGHKVKGEMLSGIAAELVMVGGYLVFESILYGFAPSLVNVPLNGIQGVAGLVTGLVLLRIIKKSKINLL